MDEIVLRAMAKWPNVPAVYGWLALDRRGRWLIKGDPIANPTIVDFIARNYACDERGRWFFQNGPQRVYVELAYLPLVLRLTPADTLVTHTHRAVTALKGGWIDDEGSLIFATEHGPGLVDDRDTETLTMRLTDRRGDLIDEDTALERVEQMQQGRDSDLGFAWNGASITLAPIRLRDVETRFAFVAHPQPEPHGAACP